MRIIIIAFSALIFSIPNAYSQQKLEDDMEKIFNNAKKGVYWALSNLHGKKAKFEKSLIAEDQLVAKVRVNKELNGVRIESSGYYQTNELTITIFKSSENLIKDGYIKKGELELYSEEQ